MSDSEYDISEEVADEAAPMKTDDEEWLLRHEVQQLRSSLYAAHTFPDWERTRRDRVAMWFQRHWFLWGFAGMVAGVGIGLQL